MFEAARNRSARLRNVLVILASLSLLYSGPLIWPLPPDAPHIPAPLMTLTVAALCTLLILPASAILSRRIVFGRDPLRHRDMLAGHTLYGWRNVDLDRLVSVRVLDLWQRGGRPNVTYFVLRDEHGAQLAVGWPNRDVQRALRRAVGRRRENLRLSPFAAGLLEVDRAHRYGPPVGIQW